MRATTTGATGVAVRRRAATAGWLAVLAVGLGCLATTALAAALGGSVLVVRTGSMTPALPVGAAVLARPVPAASAHVGDVLAVRHPDGRLVIHRLVSTAPAPGAPGLRTLVLRGDANTVDDPPVLVDTVLRPVVTVARGWPGRVAAVLQARWTQFWLGAASGALATAEWVRAGRRRQARTVPAGRRDTAATDAGAPA